MKKDKNILNFIKTHLFLLVSSLLTITLIVVVSVQYISFRKYEPIFVVRENVKVEKLSKYNKKLEGTYGDTDIFIIGDQNPDEPSILVLGGVHPNEPAGQIAATLLLEQVDVSRGTVYIITEANRSAYTHSHPQEASPFYYDIETYSNNIRTFKYGSRATNAVDQWPISDVYVHRATGQKLSGTDTRNLNRSFPGSEKGNFTEWIASAIINLINERKILLTIDFHEASPEYGTNNALVYHQKDEKFKISGLVSMKFSSYSRQNPSFKPIKIEESPQNLRGLTHREIGDNTDAIPFLAETSNVTQGRIRGPVTKENIVSGEDKFYEKASALGILEVDHSESVSLHERVGRHVQTFIFLIESFNMFSNLPYNESDTEMAKYKKGSFEIDYKGMDFINILNKGIGYYLLDPIE